MLKKYKYPALIILVSGICLFSSLGETRFWDDDEGFFASTAAEMYAKGDWIVPYFNGDVFGHKPPWMYWMMMIGYWLFGVGEFGARFFSAIFGIATALLTFQLGRRLFSERVGFIAGLMMPTCIMFGVVSRAATPDVFLVFFAMLSLYIFVAGGIGSRKLSLDQLDGSAIESMLPAKWSTWAALYAVMGLAVLVKGPIGFLFPMAVIGLFLLIMTPSRDRGMNQQALSNRNISSRIRLMNQKFGPVNFFRTVWRMRPFTAIAMILIVSAPWYVAVGWKTDGLFLSEFFGVHHWQRFTTPMDNHAGPAYYYLIAILAGMFPWSIFAGPAIIEWMKDVRNKDENSKALLFVASWAAVYVVIFSLASTKLPNYVLPAYPALALMIGYFLDRAIAKKETRHVLGVTASFAVLMIVGGLSSVGLLSLANPQVMDFAWIQQLEISSQLVNELSGLTFIGIPLALGGFIALWFTGSKSLKPAIGISAVASIVFVITIWNVAAPKIDKFQATPQIAEKFLHESADVTDSAEIGCYYFFRPSMVFYTGQDVNRLEDGMAARDFLFEQDDRYLITDSEGYSHLVNLHSRIEIVAEEKNFLQKGNLMLLRTRPTVASIPNSPKKQ